MPDLVINARTDVHLFQVGDPADRPGEVCTRAAAYAASEGALSFPELDSQFARSTR